MSQYYSMTHYEAARINYEKVPQALALSCTDLFLLWTMGLCAQASSGHASAISKCPPLTVFQSQFAFFDFWHWGAHSEENFGASEGSGFSKFHK